MKEAMYYKKMDKNVQCLLCPHYCVIRPDGYGRCQTRQNLDGKLYAMNYGRITAAAIDPIEKKPLYHFYPGKTIFSVSSYGCNMSCKFCQNHELSQQIIDVDEISIDRLIENIQGIGIAFTYNEPLTFYEYILDVAKEIKDRGLDYKIVLITNGFINPEPLKELLPYIDAFNVDLKSFNDDYYKKICGGMLTPVLKSIELMAEKHLEATTLMVTDEVTNADIEKISQFIAGIDSRIPLHISRYFPNYHYDKKRTADYILDDAYITASKYLEYVYVGNTFKDNHTYCKSCKNLLVKRVGFHTEVINKSPVCEVCGYKHHIVGIGE